MKSSGLKRIWHWLRWPVYIVVVLFVLYIAYGLYLHIEKDKDDAAVATIHAQKITMADVLGTNLPPMPNKIENDATVAGIDKNNNGIRDDVELAIFEKYPGQANAKIRAAELQYAMTEQMFLTRVFDTATWKAVAEENGRAHLCILQSNANRKEIEDWVFNTPVRNENRDKVYDFITGYGPAAGIPCDVSL